MPKRRLVSTHISRKQYDIQNADQDNKSEMLDKFTILYKVRISIPKLERPYHVVH